MMEDVAHTKFSDILTHNTNSCEYSPNGSYFAFATQSHVFVKDVYTLDVISSFSCVYTVDLIQWSPDSEYILCAILKKGIIQVWSLEDSKWSCKIDEGVVRFVNVCWSPDSRHVLTTAEHQLRITIWSLVSKQVLHLRYPKTFAFSPCEKYLAVATRQQCRDYITILKCDSWQFLKQYECAISDLSGMSWSPKGDVTCVWDSPFNEVHLLFYSLDGRNIGSYKATGGNCKLGIKTASWSPSGSYLAVGCYDEKVRLIFTTLWTEFAEYGHSSQINSSDVVVYKLIEKDGIFSPWSKYEQLNERPVSVPLTPQTNDLKCPPRMGIGSLVISSNSRYIATVSDSMPTAVWVYDAVALKLLHVILQSQPVKSLSWCPSNQILAICTGSNALYTWSPKGCMVVQSPYEEPFLVNGAKWHPKDSALLLTGKGKSAILRLS